MRQSVVVTKLLLQPDSGTLEVVFLDGRTSASEKQIQIEKSYKLLPFSFVRVNTS